MALSYGITSESQLIDVSAIQAACDQIDQASDDFTTTADKVQDAKGYCGKGALEVDGKTMEESFDQVSEALGTAESNIKGFTQSIMQTAYKIHYAQEQELAEYRRQQAEKQNNQ